MGQCPYVDDSKSGPSKGWYCSIQRGSAEYSLHRNYCRDSINCKYCPVRGGDDRLRKPPEPKPEPKKSSSSSYYDSYSSNSSSSSSSSSSGGGGGYVGGGGIGCGFLLVAGIILVVVLVVIGFLIHWGVLGPWVQMQMPNGVNHKGFSLYTVGGSEPYLFDVRDKSFNRERISKLALFDGSNDLYLEYDDASVLISSPNSLDIHLLNTVNIETSAYQNAMEQMVRPVILQLKDSEGNPLTADGLQVMDQTGSPLSVVILSDDTCAVLLGDNTAVSALTVRLSGYADCQIPVDAGQRLSMLAVTMNK